MRALLMVVVAIVATGCAAAGARPQPFPSGPSDETTPETWKSREGVGTATAPTGYAVSGTALQLRGTPSRNGGTAPYGFDCIGLVWYVFAQHGLALPRTVEDQFLAGGEVLPANLQPGDLVFFSTTSRGASHVGIVIGGDSFIHAPSSTGVVRVERLSASYWSSRYMGARRVLPVF